MVLYMKYNFSKGVFMKKTLSVLLALLMILTFIPVFSYAENSVTANGIVEISKYGNVKINLSHAVITENFKLGDIVTVTFGEVSIDVPLCITFSDVDSGKAGLFCQVSGGVEETELAINMGNFAETYGIAKKTTSPTKLTLGNTKTVFQKTHFSP